MELRIDCIPVPWASHGGYGRHSYNKRHAEKLFYQTHWKRVYLQNYPIDLPVHCSYIFAFPYPKSLKRSAELTDTVYHTKRPDTSNLIKFAEDTLKEIVITDDSLVFSLEARKIYDEIPHTIVKIITY